MELARDAHAEFITTAKDCLALPEATAALEKSVRDFRLIFTYEGSRMPVQKALGLTNFLPAYALMQEKVKVLSDVLESQAERDPAIENCWQRGLALQQKLHTWQAADNANLVRWGRGLYPIRAVTCHAIVSGGGLWQTTQRATKVMDIYFCHARGQKRFQPLLEPDGLGASHHRLLEQPI